MTSGLLLLLPATATATLAALPQVEIALDGARRVAIKVNDAGNIAEATFDLPPVETKTVVHEYYKTLKLWNPKAAGWQQQALLKTKSQECNTPFVYQPGTLDVTDGRETGARVYKRGADYEVNEERGTFGRLEGGAIPADGRVYASYNYAPQRIDSIALTPATGRLDLVPGKPHITSPLPPELADGQIRVANILTHGSRQTLAPENLYPIRETAFPGPGFSDVAEKLLPKTLQKLRSGASLKILAWGDSVTGGGFVPKGSKWQEQFIVRLKKRFPDATIELVTVGWGGHNTSNFLYNSKGTPFEYGTKVLGSGADLVISEFVNDSGLGEPHFRKNYNRILADFRTAGFEWIVMTPHYTSGMKEQPEDTRPYVRLLKKFAADNALPLADASAHYGRLHLQGLSFPTLMANAFNHPDPRGMKLFADALLSLFPEK
jgi:lysophospholipase L1-like esterase